MAGVENGATQLLLLKLHQAPALVLQPLNREKLKDSIIIMLP